jgi:hypothetical protein
MFEYIMYWHRLLLLTDASGSAMAGTGNSPVAGQELARSDNSNHARQRHVLADCIMFAQYDTFLLCLYVERMPDWRMHK